MARHKKQGNVINRDKIQNLSMPHHLEKDITNVKELLMQLCRLHNVEYLYHYVFMQSEEQ